MCGIYGILSVSEGKAEHPDILDRMGNIMVHRGPDDYGAYVEPGIWLGMRRLSIIDVEGGHQPIPNETETVWTVCNGEIYNFRELRTELSQHGHMFRSNSDSEVVVHAYEHYGDEFVTRLDGMYGFAVWDVKRRRLLVGRDRLGIKPLYYFNDGSRLIFASEAKSILAVPGVRAELDHVALKEYLTLGYTPAPYSMFRGIQKLPPASMLVWENGRCEIRTYWQFPNEVDVLMNEQEWAESVREQFEAAVVSQMVSDVPLGAFLSGGIDSSSVVAMMANNSVQPVKTYAIGFEDSEGGRYYNELPYARRVAELFGTDHKEILVKPDVARLLPDLLWHMDEPMADAAFITTYLVAEFARRDVTVILSGVGGDELFGGYRRYLGEYYGQYYNRLPEWMRRHVLTPIARRLPSDRHSPLLNLSRYARSFMLSNALSFEERYRTYVQVFNRAQRGRLLQESMHADTDSLGTVLAESGYSDTLQRLLYADLSTQLPDDLLMLTDKMTMAVSLECRVPILDQRLVELSARMPTKFKIHGRQLKHILKVAFNDILPDDILHRKKRGFGAPMGAWVKGALSPLMKYILSKESIQARGIFDWEEVERTIVLHEANREDHTDHLLALMNFEIWSRMYLDGLSPEEVSAQLQGEFLH